MRSFKNCEESMFRLEVELVDVLIVSVVPVVSAVIDIFSFSFFGGLIYLCDTKAALI